MKALYEQQDKALGDFLGKYKKFGVINRHSLIEKVKNDPIFAMQFVEDVLAEKSGTPEVSVNDVTGEQTAAAAKEAGFGEPESAQPDTPSNETLPEKEDQTEKENKHEDK